MNFDDEFRGNGTSNLARVLAKLRPADQLHVWKLVADKWRELRKLPAGVKRAKEVHRMIDAEIERTQKESTFNPSCKKRCTHCCYHEVVVSDDEAMLLAQLAEELLTPLELEKLHAQAKWTFGTDSWEKHKKNEKRCVFLDINTSKCRIYEDRPVACRKYFVSSPPEMCADPEGQVLGITVNNAEIIASAALNLSKKLEALPVMTVRHLKGEKHD